MNDFHRERARAAKAAEIAAKLVEHGHTDPKKVAFMDADERASWAAEAGQKAPSSESWGVVVGLLEHRKAHPPTPMTEEQLDQLQAELDALR